MATRNSELLASFTKYCEEHPDERFWQALRNWSGEAFILAGEYQYRTCKIPWNKDKLRDTFYWEGKNGN